jgi:cell fate (sporulation/competence/biofilm development) regulator YlbF (YheA/YmcA/DUF963 family)
MNIHDKAYELARAIRESEAYRGMVEAKTMIDKDADSKRVLDDFRSRQMQLQEKMMKGEMPPQDEMESMNKLYEVVALNPAIARLFDAERRLSVTLEDVQRIIAAPLEDIAQGK